MEILGISDCFEKAEKALEINPDDLFLLRMDIHEDLMINQEMYNRGVALLSLDENEEISEQTYQKVRNDLTRKHY